MSGGTAAFVTLKVRSPLSCTGTMDQDNSGTTPAGPGIVNAARDAAGSDQVPAPYHAARAGPLVFPGYQAAGGGRS
jgi:hypothetical protein